MAIAMTDLCGYRNDRPVVTFPSADHHRLLTGIKLYCLVTGTQRCEQLAESWYAAVPSPAVEPAMS